MSKKTISLLIVVVVLLASSSVFAVNGTYEGFPTVNVKVNGQTIESDVPAINLNGRTMVPVRFVSEALGANVTWDGSTNTAIINKPSEEMVVLEIIVLDTFKYLEDFGEYIQDLNAYMLGVKTENQLKTAVEHKNWIVNEYNTLIADLKSNNDLLLYDPDGTKLHPIADVMEHYKKSIEYIEKGIYSLDDFYATNVASYHTDYLSLMINSEKEVDEGIRIAFENYLMYRNKLIR